MAGTSHVAADRPEPYALPERAPPPEARAEVVSLDTPHVQPPVKRRNPSARKDGRVPVRRPRSAVALAESEVPARLGR